MQHVCLGRQLLAKAVDMFDCSWCVSTVLCELCRPAGTQPNSRKALTDTQIAIQVASWLSHANNTAIAYRGRCDAEAVKQTLLFSQGRV